VSIFIRVALVASHVCKIRQNSNRIQTYSTSRSSWHIKVENSMFCASHSCLMAPSGRTPSNINPIYTLLKSVFCGLQYSCRHYGSIFYI